MSARSAVGSQVTHLPFYDAVMSTWYDDFVTRQQ
jgi:hypothetical protein